VAKTDFFKPNKIYISHALREQLCDLATQDKTHFGLVTVNIGESSFELNEYFDVGCRSGPVLHLYPDFSKLHRTKRYLEMIGKAPMVEFHTHIKSDTELHIKDIEKMKMLRRGYWIIGGNNGLAFYFFYHKPKQNTKNMMTLVTEKIEL